jgi:hypothetical protein
VVAVDDRRRRPWWLVVVAVVAVGVAVRAGFLYWSPFPATLDGVRYARLATDTLATGRLSFAALDADELVFTLVVAVTSAVVGDRPFTFAQPTVAVLGGAVGLVGVVVLRRFRGVFDRGSAGAVYRAGAAVGLALAVEGVLLRRSGTPDEEALALVVVPLFAVAAVRAFRTRRPAWVVVAGALAATFPPLHNFGTTVAALVLTALVCVEAVDRPDPWRALGGGIVVVGAFWAYFFGYFELAGRLGVRVTYSGLLGERPGVFLAWLVVLAVGTVWLRTTTVGLRRVAIGLPFVAFFGLVGGNAVRPVFPGTIPTAPGVLRSVVPYALPVAAFVLGTAALGLGREKKREGAPGPTDGPVVVLALLTGPLVVVSFALTTALTPQFLSVALRGQNYLHLAVFVLAGVGAVVLTRRVSLRGAGTGLLVGVVLAAAVTTPLAFVNLNTGAAPNTVLESDVRATTFASTHLSGAYATDFRVARVAGHWLGATTQTGPTATFLDGGPPPGCPTLAKRSWTTVGAPFFPAPARTTTPERYDAWQRTNEVVYATAGARRMALVLPRDGGSCE